LNVDQALSRLHELTSELERVGPEYDSAALELTAVLQRQRVLHTEFLGLAHVVGLAGRSTEIPAPSWGRFGSHHPVWQEVGPLPSRTGPVPLWPPQR
jgi:hypothetical protein